MPDLGLYHQAMCIADNLQHSLHFVKTPGVPHQTTAR